MSRILWLLAARSGSKGIPDKNVKPLAGVPLLAYRIRSQQQTKTPGELWVSTDSQHYADLAASYGAHVPFLRPSELARDEAGSMDVVLHAMTWAEAMGHQFDALGLLEPTSPFTRPEWLDQAVEALFADPAAQAVVAVRAVHPSSYYVQPEGVYLSEIAARIHGEGVKRRQEEAQEVTPSGNFYIAKWEALKHTRSFYTSTTRMMVLPDPYGLEIDRPMDWHWAEFLLERGLVSRDEFGFLPSGSTR